MESLSNMLEAICQKDNSSRRVGRQNVSDQRIEIGMHFGQVLCAKIDGLMLRKPEALTRPWVSCRGRLRLLGRKCFQIYQQLGVIIRIRACLQSPA